MEKTFSFEDVVTCKNKIGTFVITAIDTSEETPLYTIVLTGFYGKGEINSQDKENVMHVVQGKDLTYFRKYGNGSADIKI